MKPLLGILACVLVVASCDDPKHYEANALALERSSCRDTDWARAYMMRRPGDPHGIEFCEHVARGAPPRFSPPIYQEAAR